MVIKYSHNNLYVLGNGCLKVYRLELDHNLDPYENQEGLQIYLEYHK